MLRTYRFPLRPFAQQRAALWDCLRQCCTLYNAALEQRINGWKKHRRSIGFFEQMKDLTDLREEPDWWAMPLEAQRSALRRVEAGFKSFYRRCKAGQTPGHPRFRGIDRYDSFGIGRPIIEPSLHEGGSGYVHVPKIGRVRFKQHRMIQGVVRDATIRRDVRGRWFVQIACDLGDEPIKRVVRAGHTTGIDLGLTHFAVLADGTEIDNPRHFKRSADLLGRRQRALAQKKRGSRSRRSRQRARVLVARTHEHVRNQRLDFHRKLAKQLVATYDVICHEDLNIRGLAQGWNSKGVADVGWGQFIRILHCKAEEAGVYVIPVDPRGTTQICSACGRAVPKRLGDRVHRCECGLF